MFSEKEGTEGTVEVVKESGEGTETCDATVKVGSEEKESSIGLESTERFEGFTQEGKAVEDEIMD